MTAGEILIVDDHDMVREVLARHLHQIGHHTVGASSGVAALALMRAQSFDLVLLDVMMPGMSGLDVLRAVKADAALHELPVIVLSADTDMESIVTSIKLGADDYLHKPFNPVLLNARVSASLEKRRLRRREQEYLHILEQRVAERSALAEERAAALERSEASLRRQSAILQSILDSIGDGVIVVDTQGNLVSHNPAAEQILGEHLAALLPKGSDQGEYYLPDMVNPCPAERLPLALAVSGAIIDGAELFIPCNCCPEGQWLSFTARPLRDGAGEIAGGVAVFRDVSAAKRAEAQLRYRALHDALTGLANRALFLSRLDHLLMRQHEQRRPFALIFLDLDGLKTVNDSYGHHMGDELLIAVARRLEGCVRSSDTVARLGGDEFTILLEDVADARKAHELAARIQGELSAPLLLHGEVIHPTASIGIALSDGGYSHAAELIRDADSAMYHAKMSGKARHVIFAPLVNR